MDTTKLIDMVHESRRASDQFSGKALENESNHMAAAAEIYNQYWESSVEYIEKKNDPLLTELFLRLGQYHVPGLLFWPVAVLIKLAGLPARWLEMVKRKMRSRYYAWKKSLVG